MLQIKDICKEYRTGSLVQKALDHVSLNLRDNEFVAILGPSGSGKTTLLNIIGGLDRYDSGDLIINGISTKRYKDRDWDSYRNHTIGFVFQSYNLIPHQTILSNVELALTISGISGNERRLKSIAALEKVGLGEQIHKKPSQLSGGQMQRVAIARALVNDPDILLADEPTGALDSETSITIMDLLKEVASDRLVVMVTHNPELAEEYATRIVKLKDGHILGDTDPFLPEETGEEAVHQNMGKASMSFLTALALSFNNLRTKLTRTLLVSFAGSIGIIGIALILSLSTGVNRYIKDIEEETLLEYPLGIQNNSISLSSLMEFTTPEPAENKTEKEVTERRIASTMFSKVNSNDLASLKSYFESPDSKIELYTRAIEYGYNISPLIYRMEKDEARQVNPDTSYSALGFSSSSLMFSSAMSTDVFQQLPKDPVLYKESYELKAGHWPESPFECVLVISESGNITDTVLYTLGFKDADELTAMMESFSAGNSVKEDNSPLLEFSYEDFIGIVFKVVNNYEKYSYDEEYDVWTDKGEDKKYINDLAKNGKDLVITGVVQAKPDASVTTLFPGIYYPESLTMHLIEKSSQSRITRAQLSQRDIDVFSGKRFNDTSSENDEFSLENLFSVDTNALNKVFSFDSSKLSVDTDSFTNNLDFSDMNAESMIDPNSMSDAMPDMSSFKVSDLLSNVTIKVNYENLLKMAQTIIANFQNDEASMAKISQLDQSFQDYLKGETYPDFFPEEMKSHNIMSRHIKTMITKTAEQTITTPLMAEFVKTIMSGFPDYYQSLPDDQKETAIDTYVELDTTRDAISNAITNLIIAEFIARDIPEDELTAMTTDLIAGYEAYAKITEKPSLSTLTEVFNAYLASESTQKIIREGISSSVNMKEIENSINKSIESMTEELTDGIQKGITNMMNQFMTKFTEQLTEKLSTAMSSNMSQIAKNMNNAFSINPNAFAEAISMNMDEQELSELLTALLTTQPATYDSNMKLLGYADTKKPYTITIYPRDFESKSEVLNILDSYNERMKKEDENKVITYTDTVGLLMSSVTDIINAISYVLIAFVAISLVVSSIMIGVITYISVLERRKEIGILRAIGASKRNVSSVFNAETFIIGLLAGIFGIIITLILLIPGNQIIHHFTDAEVYARLPFDGAILLILLSVVLTMLGGLIPSRTAAKSDPVTALRSD